MADGNDEQISQFLAFTGSSDPSKALSYLEMSGNNVETAVGLYMEHEQGGGLGSATGGGPTNNAGAPMMGGDDSVRAPDATRTMRLMDVDPVMGMQPHGDPAFHLMNAMMDEEIAQSAFAAPPTDARAALNAAIAAQGQGVNVDPYNQQDEKENEDEKENSEDSAARPASNNEAAGLSGLFEPPNHLIHRAGGFQGARTMAKDTRRWLLVNLQRDSEFASHALNRDVWRDELVENLVRSGFIFWQQMDMHPEGRTFSERYQVNAYPHISIIDPRTGRLLFRKEGWTLQNPVTAEVFAEIAMDFCSRNSFDKPPQAPRPSVGAATRPGKRPVQEMSESEQLQAAMRASMHEDNDDDDEVQYIHSDDDDEDAVDVVDDSKPEAQNLQSTQSTFVEELLSFSVPDEPADGSAIRLRMPDGKRAVRKFAPGDSVRTIYAFVAQTNEEAKDGKEFVLMAGYPPHDLVEGIDTTIEEAKLKGEAIAMRWK